MSQVAFPYLLDHFLLVLSPCGCLFHNVHVVMQGLSLWHYHSLFNSTEVEVYSHSFLLPKEQRHSFSPFTSWTSFSSYSMKTQIEWMTHTTCVTFWDTIQNSLTRLQFKSLDFYRWYGLPVGFGARLKNDAPPGARHALCATPRLSETQV